nr:MAG TPA: hypothetical protein [Caudoviricetes sp.]
MEVPPIVSVGILTEAIHKVGANVISLGTKDHVAIVMVFNIHCVLLTLAAHVLVSCLVSSHPNPIGIDLLKEAVINAVTLTNLLRIHMVKNLNLDVVSVILTSEDINNLCGTQNGIAADRVLGISVGGGTNDSIDSKHIIFPFLIQKFVNRTACRDLRG